jgi:hypothetical protein
MYQTLTRNQLISEYGEDLLNSFEKLYGEKNYEVFEEKFCGYYPDPETFGQEIYQHLYGHTLGTAEYKSFKDYMTEEFPLYYWYDEELQVVFIRE